MRKTVLLLASVAVAMVVLGGVAWAATIDCPNATRLDGTPFCEGTNDPDTMHGTAKTDRMYANAGGDTIYGYRGADYIEGAEGPDKIYAGRGGANSLSGRKEGIYGDEGPDKLYGGSGGDFLYAHGTLLPDGSYPEDTSTDYLHGGSGNDRLEGGFEQGGVDRLYGEKGDDSFDVAQRRDLLFVPFTPVWVTKEIVDCGPGIDSVDFDKDVDVVKNCEKKSPYSKR
jgi:Ca2+-binding RTX toxin-like protein